jgi:hypothetical protein
MVKKSIVKEPVIGFEYIADRGGMSKNSIVEDSVTEYEAVNTKKYTPTKKKSTAVWIAVLFGIFSWIYTWKYDAWKFWVNLALTLFTGGLWGIVALIWVIIDQATKPRELFEDYYN